MGMGAAGLLISVRVALGLVATSALLAWFEEASVDGVSARSERATACTLPARRGRPAARGWGGKSA
jgi:hypothetical protein